MAFGALHVAPNEITASELVQKYLTIRRNDVNAGILAVTTFREYLINLDDFVKFINAVMPDAGASTLTPIHFTAYPQTLENRGLGPHALKRVIACIKAAFRFAVEARWVKEVRFGRAFVSPNTDPEAVALWHMRHGHENRLDRILTRREVRQLLRAVKDKPRWKAGICPECGTLIPTRSPADVPG